MAVIGGGYDSPAARFAGVTPNDSTDLPGGTARAIFVGGSGNVVVTGPDGVDATFVSGASQYHPIMVARVKSTGTTATSIVALY